MRYWISLVPRPSRPSACRLQYKRGGRPGKTESRGMTYWTCRGVAHSWKTRN